MNLFGVGPTEIFVVLIVILVLFGPDKLPELAKKIGGASREIREGLDSINEQMNTALETSMEMEKATMLKPAAQIPTTSDVEPIAPPDESPANGIAPENSPTDTARDADANPSQP
jgi:sec-independent protein translocase protein TatA